MQTKYLKDITISRYLFVNLVTIFFFITKCEKSSHEQISSYAQKRILSDY